MARVWKYKEYTIDEGAKPRDGKFKEDHFQYFFLVKEGDRRLMKFCVWAPKSEIEEIAGTSEATGAVEYLREEGVKYVTGMIDEDIFENTLLEIRADGRTQSPLDTLSEKKE